MIKKDRLRIPMNKSADYRLGWTKYSDLYFPPKLRLDLVSLRVFTGAELNTGNTGLLVT